MGTHATAVSEAHKKMAAAGIHTLSGDDVHVHTNGLLSDGALGQLINSHINEGMSSNFNNSVEQQQYILMNKIRTEAGNTALQ